MLRRFLIKQIRLRERLWQDSVKGVSLMTYWLDSREFLRMMNPVRRGRVALGRAARLCVCVSVRCRPREGGGMSAIRPRLARSGRPRAPDVLACVRVFRGQVRAKPPAGKETSTLQSKIQSGVDAAAGPRASAGRCPVTKPHWEAIHE